MLMCCSTPSRAALELRRLLGPPRPRPDGRLVVRLVGRRGRQAATAQPQPLVLGLSAEPEAAAVFVSLGDGAPARAAPERGHEHPVSALHRNHLALPARGALGDQPERTDSVPVPPRPGPAAGRTRAPPAPAPTKSRRDRREERERARDCRPPDRGQEDDRCAVARRRARRPAEEGRDAPAAPARPEPA